MIGSLTINLAALAHIGNAIEMGLSKKKSDEIIPN